MRIYISIYIWVVQLKFFKCLLTEFIFNLFVPKVYVNLTLNLCFCAGKLSFKHVLHPYTIPNILQRSTMFVVYLKNSNCVSHNSLLFLMQTGRQELGQEAGRGCRSSIRQWMGNNVGQPWRITPQLAQLCSYFFSIQSLSQCNMLPSVTVAPFGRRNFN